MPFARREAQNAEAEKTPAIAAGGEIDDLKRQLDEMQKRIEKLSDTKLTDTKLTDTKTTT
jgi:hypothetical protein